MINKLISYFGTFTPGADGAVGAFQFEYLTSLGFAALVIFAGRAIVRRSHVLRKFAIPAPVISGLLFSVLIAIFKGTGIFAISFDTKNSGGGSYMKQGRDTTQEERVRIVKDCLASGKNYGEMALKYKVGAVLAIRGMAANRCRQRLLLKAGEVRKNEFEVDRSVNFH